ncbi:hypothetical protein LBWT_55100 [Leptolyngbya boryana IAM M-101]|nr:hypothetical protein LBWT_55100 [Leptolyngbya boryana IAM M-101]BAS65886.1 hypothetical protein LBDG_55100 [Leptolyngbya boryana dg5]
MQKYLYGNASGFNYVDPTGYFAMNMVQTLAMVRIASAIANIFNIGDINPFSTDILSEIDPARGLRGQINFNPWTS